MADVTAKALNLCSRLVDAADSLMQSIEKLNNLKDEKESAGIDFTAVDVEAAIAASSLKHCTGSNFNSVLSSTVAVTNFMVTNFHDDVFDTVRP